MILIYPKNFTSTQTYQNSNYTFPHNDALSVTTEQLKNHFYNPDYILPDYIKYSGRDISIDMLKSPVFTTLGISFIKLKNLEEKLDSLFDTAFEWKKTHVNPKFQHAIDHYITLHYYNEMVLMVSNLTTVVQLMIINYIDGDLYIDDHIIALLNQFNAIRMTELPVGITIYLTRIIPILIALSKFDYKIL